MINIDTKARPSYFTREKQNIATKMKMMVDAFFVSSIV